MHPIGLIRAKAKVGRTNLAHNMRRLVHLRRPPLPGVTLDTKLRPQRPQPVATSRTGPQSQLEAPRQAASCRLQAAEPALNKGKKRKTEVPFIQPRSEKT